MDRPLSSRSEDEFVKIQPIEYSRHPLPYQIASDECFMDIPRISQLPMTSVPDTNHVHSQEMTNTNLVDHKSILIIQPGMRGEGYNHNAKITSEVFVMEPDYRMGFSGDTIQSTLTQSDQMSTAEIDNLIDTQLAKNFLNDFVPDPLLKTPDLPLPEPMMKPTPIMLKQPERVEIPKKMSMSTVQLEEDSSYVDLSAEDRNKAIAWAAALNGQPHISFIPEMVLQTGFQIKRFGLWIPLAVSVDYEHHHLTFMYPESLLEILQRRMVAHRIDAGDIRVETPKTKKKHRSSNGPQMSKRRLVMTRCDGKGSYSVIGPSQDYRNRFLDILTQFGRPSAPEKQSALD